MHIHNIKKDFKHALEYKKGIVAWNKPNMFFVLSKAGHKLAVYQSNQEAKEYLDNWALLYNN